MVEFGAHIMAECKVRSLRSDSRRSVALGLRVCLHPLSCVEMMKEIRRNDRADGTQGID